MKCIASILTILLLFSVSHTGAVHASSRPSADAVLNLLVATDAGVRLKRERWTSWRPVLVGADLFPGDLIEPEKGARAIVLCGDLTIWPAPPGVKSGVNNGCPTPREPMLKRGKALIVKTRGATDPRVPFIISPRKTRLLDGAPTLRWNASPGVSRYTVSVMKDGAVHWRTETDRTRIAYPGKPPLEPGETYLLVVNAENGKSSRDEGGVGLGFKMLRPEEGRRVREIRGKLAGIKLPEHARSFTLARFYAGYSLRAEAIEILEKMIEAGAEVPAVERVVAVFYQQLGLPLLAGSHYIKALKLAENAGDIEGRALARIGLSDVSAVFGNLVQATEHLEKARDAYKLLGDEKTVTEIEKKLKDYKSYF